MLNFAVVSQLDNGSVSWYQLWWQETGSLTAGCRCLIEEGQGTSWALASDGTYLHCCGSPSVAVLRSQDLLNLFRFGPQHNTILDTSALTTDRVVAGWITEYRWTPEKIIGSVSGKEARVWVHKESSATS